MKRSIAKRALADLLDAAEANEAAPIESLMEATLDKLAPPEGWEDETPWMPQRIKVQEYGGGLAFAAVVADCEDSTTLPMLAAVMESWTHRHERLPFLRAMVDAYNREQQAKERDSPTASEKAYAEGLEDGAEQERARWMSKGEADDWPDGWAPRVLWERQTETIRKLQGWGSSEPSLPEDYGLADRVSEPDKSDLSVISAIFHAGTVADEHGEDDLSVCLDLLHMLWEVGGAASVRKLLERAVDKMLGALNAEAGADSVTLQAKGEPSNLRPGTAQNSVGMGRTWAPETKGEPDV